MGSVSLPVSSQATARDQLGAIQDGLVRLDGTSVLGLRSVRHRCGQTCALSLAVNVLSTLARPHVRSPKKRVSSRHHERPFLGPPAWSLRSRRKCERGASWCNVVYRDDMASAEKGVRQSVTLPARVARRVKSLAKTNGTSANRIIVELIESGIEAREQEKKRFIDLADRLTRSRDPEEQRRLKEELAVMTFGE